MNTNNRKVNFVIKKHENKIVIVRNKIKKKININVLHLFDEFELKKVLKTLNIRQSDCRIIAEKSIQFICPYKNANKYSQYQNEINESLSGDLHIYTSDNFINLLMVYRRKNDLKVIIRVINNNKTSTEYTRVYRHINKIFIY